MAEIDCGEHTRCYRPGLIRSGQHPASSPRWSTGGGNPRYCGTGSPIPIHSGEQVAQLIIDPIPSASVVLHGSFSCFSDPSV